MKIKTEMQAARAGEKLRQPILWIDWSVLGLIDLHVHSTKSDGSFTPAQLVGLALEKGLSVLGLTDHDTVEGVDEALRAAEGTPLTVVPGIEFSTEYQGRDIHILGLDIDYRSAYFRERIKAFQDSRTLRNEKMCARLQTAGFDITYDKLLATSPGAVITRSHYAEYLLMHGYIKSRKEAFERYIGDHCPYFIPREKITPMQAIELILQAGGIPVLAHPTLYGYGKVQLDKLVDDLTKVGLMGIEGLYCSYTPAEERDMQKLAYQYHLKISGGSDFHGTIKPGLELGTGYGNLKVPDFIWTDLLAIRNTSKNRENR